MVVPFVLRSIFAELGRVKAGDSFYILNYDGEFRRSPHVAVIAGTQSAEDRMLESIGDATALADMGRNTALAVALKAWCAGAREALRRTALLGRDRDDDDLNPLKEFDGENADQVFLKDELKSGTVEVGLLERKSGSKTDARFRLLDAGEVSKIVDEFLQ
jgi:hypothetical protein